jgi:hypothetical protein
MNEPPGDPRLPIPQVLQTGNLEASQRRPKAVLANPLLRPQPQRRAGALRRNPLHPSQPGQARPRHCS